MNNKKELLNNLYKKFENFKETEIYINGAKNIVFGEGNFDSKIMFIGEAPGEKEDLIGSPFVGKSGNFFEKIINELNFFKKDIFITNVLKCRPPKNRKPLKIELEKGMNLILKYEIEIIKPKIIVTLGSSALNVFFKIKKISEIRGKILNSKYGLIFPTFHPLSAMTNSKNEKLFKDDLRNIFSILN